MLSEKPTRFPQRLHSQARQEPNRCGFVTELSGGFLSRVRAGVKEKAERRQNLTGGKPPLHTSPRAPRGDTHGYFQASSCHDVTPGPYDTGLRSFYMSEEAETTPPTSGNHSDKLPFQLPRYILLDVTEAETGFLH
ncbi:hypothetical protein AMELA_G00252220 [Ameiurus melas]|uniref:Uncharacterized protein n=1 Tax=Ameiurus melas TaxID=219545 RepID=A0A7J5ZT74_AMEME|nr:hypothetical protein AMELA_G00252220 [Ameiurus melas]